VLGGRGSGAAGTVHNGQCCTSSPDLVFPGASLGPTPQRPTPGMSRPGSFRTKVESAAGNRMLPSNATNASQLAPARRHACKRSSSGECVIRSSNRAFCPLALPRSGRKMQGLTTWCRDQRGTSVRQIRQPQRPGGRRWRRMKCFVGKPPIELFAAAVAQRWRCLVMAFRVAARARKPNMKMVIVTPPRPNLRQPRPVRTCLTAQRPLDRRIDKDPRHRRLARDGLEQPVMRSEEHTSELQSLS
jgi:hypothetical protein